MRRPTSTTDRRTFVAPLIAAVFAATAAFAFGARDASSAAALEAAAAPAAPTASPAASPNGADFLKQAVAADDHVSYTGTVSTIVYGPRGANATVVRVDHRAPDKWRMWYVAPADAYGRLIVSDETTTYQYEPKNAVVYSDEWTQAPALTLDLDTAKVLKNYSIDLGAAPDVAGRKAIMLSFLSKYGGALVQRVLIDSATKLVLQRETYAADGTIDSKSSFDNIRIVSDLPKDLFDLSVPAGMHVEPGTAFGKTARDIASLQSSLGFDVIRPQYVPQGFTFDQASVGSRDGIQTVQLLYTDGLRDFSVFENSTDRLPSLESPKSIQVDDVMGETDEIAGETLLSWNAGGLNITLVGDMPARVLARIGASVRRP